MSPPSITPPRLSYSVSLTPATLISGQITIVITNPAAARCRSIVLEVPIGEAGDDVFSKAPTIRSSSAAWAASSSIATQPVAGSPASPARKGSSYQRFVVQNQDPTYAVAGPVVLTITGSVSLAKGTPQLLLVEYSTPADQKTVYDNDPGLSATFPIAKTGSALLYINSLSASSANSPTVPKTSFTNAEKIHLTWESNGDTFEVYQASNPQPIYSGTRAETDVSGVLSDTTFVLKAIRKDAYLYQAITVTIANPTFSPPLTAAAAIAATNPDTDHFLRLSDGTPNGNLVLQPLTGSNSGYTALNFNGYFNGSEQRFNLSKNRWRIITDQRGGTDLFIIDTYDGKTGNSPLVITTAGNVGLGTTTPAMKLDVVGSANVSAGVFVDGAGANTGTTANTLRLGGSGSGEGIGSKRNSGGNQYGLDFYTNYLNRLSITQGGNVGINTSTPSARLEVGGGLAVNAYNSIVSQGAHLQWNRSGGVGETWLINQRGLGPGAMLFGASDLNNNVTEWARFDGGGNLGVGTPSPAVRLHISGQFRTSTGMQFAERNNQAVNFEWYAQDGRATLYSSATNVQGLTMNRSGQVGIGTLTPRASLDVAMRSSTNIGSFHFYNRNGDGNASDGNLSDVCIYASGRIVAAEFNAVSDVRLKAVVGPSDAAADLATLRQVRITDYTMRDRAQYGDRPVKKLIGQELEQVFPQAVHQSPGFLPDVYAPARQVQAQGENLLLTLPAGLPQAAAGQRLRLIGPTGEVVATLVQAVAAGSRHLLVTGATALADSPEEVFVFGFEHADVRTVDYEAVAMLNVSATQALARQVEVLHQQTQAQHTQLETLQAALHQLQGQLASLQAGS